jgi:hypothetical protein
MIKLKLDNLKTAVDDMVVNQPEHQNYGDEMQKCVSGLLGMKPENISIANQEISDENFQFVSAIMSKINKADLQPEKNSGKMVVYNMYDIDGKKIVVGSEGGSVALFGSEKDLKSLSETTDVNEDEKKGVTKKQLISQLEAHAPGGLVIDEKDITPEMLKKYDETLEKIHEKFPEFDEWDTSDYNGQADDDFVDLLIIIADMAGQQLVKGVVVKGGKPVIEERPSMRRDIKRKQVAAREADKQLCESIVSIMPKDFKRSIYDLSRAMKEEKITIPTGRAKFLARLLKEEYSVDVSEAEDTWKAAFQAAGFHKPSLLEKEIVESDNDGPVELCKSKNGWILYLYGDSENSLRIIMYSKHIEVPSTSLDSYAENSGKSKSEVVDAVLGAADAKHGEKDSEDDCVEKLRKDLIAIGVEDVTAE